MTQPVAHIGLIDRSPVLHLDENETVWRFQQAPIAVMFPTIDPVLRPPL